MYTATFSTEPSFAFCQSHVGNVQADPLKTVPQHKTRQCKPTCVLETWSRGLIACNRVVFGLLECKDSVLIWKK